MKYTYDEKLETLVRYIRQGEKETADFKLGLELEHFLLQEESFQAVSYTGEKGVEGFLKALMEEGSWEGIYEGNNLLGLKGKDISITLEPGGQLEISLAPVKDVRGIEEIYNSFLKKVTPILKERGQVLLNLGYQPVTEIAGIELLPRERYKYMFEYFKSRGKYAHNMMKGTAST